MPHVHAEQRLQSLLEITHLLMRAVDPDEVLTVILSAALRLCDAEECSLALLDSTGQERTFVAMAGPAQAEAFRIAVGQGVAGWVAQTGQGVVCNDVTQDARFFQGVDQQTGYTTRSLLRAPLKQHDQLLGVIEVLNTARPEGFQAEDLALLMAFGSLAGTALTRTQACARVRNVGVALEEEEHSRYRLVPGTNLAMQETLRLACTGATGLHKGKFELAHGGTLFLDEIGDLAPDLQVKLLRVLQDKEFQRVGGTKDLRVDVRLLAATNRDLHQAMQRGTFREDLYYRLNVVTLTLPPLRDRREDIPVLVAHFLVQYGREVNRPGLRITPAALDVLQAYPWPGNVRELQNAIERAAVLAPDLVLTAADFPPEIRQACRPPAATISPCADLDDTRPFATAPAPHEWVAARTLSAEAAQIQQALIQTGGNVARTARLLGVSRDTVRYRMQRYGLARPRLGTPSPAGAAEQSRVIQMGLHR